MRLAIARWLTPRAARQNRNWLAEAQHFRADPAVSWLAEVDQYSADLPRVQTCREVTSPTQPARHEGASRQP